MIMMMMIIIIIIIVVILILILNIIIIMKLIKEIKLHNYGNFHYKFNLFLFVLM